MFYVQKCRDRNIPRPRRPDWNVPWPQRPRPKRFDRNGQTQSAWPDRPDWKVAYPSAIRESPVQCYSEVLDSEQTGRILLLKLTLSSSLVSFLLRWKIANIVFVELSFSFRIWRYLSTVATFQSGRSGQADWVWPFLSNHFGFQQGPTAEMKKKASNACRRPSSMRLICLCSRCYQFPVFVMQSEQFKKLFSSSTLLRSKIVFF